MGIIWKFRLFFRALILDQFSSKKLLNNASKANRSHKSKSQVVHTV